MIVRTARRNRYTVICNNLIEDPDLDWKDLGLLVYLLSKPDDWQISVEHLKKQKKLGRDGIYKCLDAIINAGYARREKHSDGSVYWYIFEEKQTEEKPNPEKPEKATDHQIRKSRNTENPNPENPTLINTEYKQRLNKEITNTEVNTPKKKKSDSATKKTKKQDDDLTIQEQMRFKPDSVDDEIWVATLKARKKRKSVQTQRAIDGFINELKRCEEAGISMSSALDQFLQNSWKTIKIEYLRNQSPPAKVNGTGSVQHPTNGRHYDTKRTKNAIDWDCDF